MLFAPGVVRPDAVAVAAQIGADDVKMLGQTRRDLVPRDMGQRVAVQQQQRRAVAAMAQMNARAPEVSISVRVKSFEHAALLSLTSCKLTQKFKACQRRRREENMIGRRIAAAVHRDVAGRCPAGDGAEIGRRPQGAALGQPGEHVDPRRGDLLGRRADDGGDEQSRHLQPARRPEQPFRHRPGPRRQLGVERGRQGADVQAASGRQMA